MTTLVREKTWGDSNHGWGCGYVLVDKSHSLFGLENISILTVHGDITFSKLVDKEIQQFLNLDDSELGKWCFGFDTSHFGDNLDNWSAIEVVKETERLEQQLMLY